MKTLTIHAPKDLRLEDKPNPTPDAGQVLVQLEAGAICVSELHYFNHGVCGAVRASEGEVVLFEGRGRGQGISKPVKWIGSVQLGVVSPCV
ncbi:MAG: L-idonate 5-dehydrogenase, partial [Arenibacterium sp.]